MKASRPTERAGVPQKTAGKEELNMTIEYKTYAKCLKVLSDETRLEIMDLLSEGEMCACALLDQFSITQPTLSYHMKMMKDCGLVDSRKDGIWVKYSVNHEKLDELKDFFQTMAKQNTTV